MEQRRGNGGTDPALPGSYGIAPPGWRLPEAARPGRVRLQVAELERSVAFYRRVLGMEVHGEGGGHAALGARGGGTLLDLVERPGAARPTAARLGLFHAAYLLPDRAALGRFVGHLAELGVPAGAGDHGVSEAFYLTDPDGLGIEVYADRPRSAWRRAGRELVMGTDPVDAAALAAAGGGARWEGMPGATVLGHVHLHVGAIEAAGAFYADALGFDRMVWSYPGALFLAAGGYHHHLGVNTWAGARARPAAEDEARLLEWTLELPDAAAVAAAAASVEAAGHPAERAGGEAIVRDPWGTALRLVSPPPPPAEGPRGAAS